MDEGPTHAARWLDALVETSPFAIGIISGAENRFVRVNRALAELYGMSADEFLHADPFSLAMRLTHPDDLVAEQRLFAEMVAGARSSYCCEKRIVRADGSVRFTLTSLTAVYGSPVGPDTPSGVLQYTIVQAVDLSERKRLEQVVREREEELRHAQKLDGIGRLAAGVAHDFNNLLTVITGYGELLRQVVEQAPQEAPAKKLGEGVRAILQAAERAAGLTAQLLAYGRRSRTSPRALHLSSEVATLEPLLARTLGPDVRVERSLHAQGSVLADSGQLGQVVMNLVLNARDALRAGGHIEIATRDVETRDGDSNSPRRFVALIVSDTGHGMSPEVRARAFEPFFTTRGDRPGTQGTGLGLSTVQRIVADASGRIEVASEEGVGTTVTVLFPRVASLHAGASAEPAVAPSPAPNSRRVLVVDDDGPVRALVGTVLLGAHYWVVVARDAEEALRFIDEAVQPFDLVVTDLLMPGQGGVALAGQLRERPDCPRMLFVSGYSDPRGPELTEHGELLPKPFTPSQLLAAVDRALAAPNRPAARPRA